MIEERLFVDGFWIKNVRFINNLIVTNDAAFHMKGMVNRQNGKTYSPYKQNPMNIFKKNISREKVSVWMGLSGHIIGPFFYEGNLNGNAYLQMLNEEIIPRLFELYGDRVDHLNVGCRMEPRVTGLMS